MTRRIGAVVLAVVLAAGAVACSSGGDESSSDTVAEDGLLGEDPGDCIVVDMAVSPEKIDLMTDLARTFNDSDDAQLGDECIFVRPQRKSSGGSDECIITSACGRGWSGSMGVTTGEVHWTETVCGAPNEAAVVAALTAFCKGQAKYAQECFLASVWDERGNEKKLEKALNPKKLK